MPIWDLPLAMTMTATETASMSRLRAERVVKSSVYDAVLPSDRSLSLLSIMP